MAKIKLILYDLDGTLVDTREDISRAANFMLGKMGRPEMHRGEIEGYVGQGLHFLIQSCLKTRSVKEVEKGAKLYRRHYVEHMLDNSRLYPGAREFLAAMRGRKQAVITNKPDPYSTQILEALGVADFFMEIIAGNADYPKKPDPGAVVAMMNTAKAKPSETVLVGDSAIDIQTGKNANIRTIVFPHGFSSVKDLKAAGSGKIVEDFEALLNLAKEEGW